MRKKLILSFVMIIICLCSFTQAFCKGELGDMDAFSTYMGKTRSEVRRIAPMFEEFSDNMYIIDWIEEDDDFLALAVMFDDYNMVSSVMVLITKGAMKIMEVDIELINAAAIGITQLGFTADDTIRYKTTDDGNLVFSMKRGITIVATEMSDTLYAVLTAQN